MQKLESHEKVLLRPRKSGIPSKLRGVFLRNPHNFSARLLQGQMQTYQEDILQAREQQKSKSRVKKRPFLASHEKCYGDGTLSFFSPLLKQHEKFSRRTSSTISDQRFAVAKTSDNSRKWPPDAALFAFFLLTLEM
jgi:hypothetical protein